jgi:hypothetical protein
VYDRFQSVGFTPEQIDAAIIRAHNKKLIDTQRAWRRLRVLLTRERSE